MRRLIVLLYTLAAVSLGTLAGVSSAQPQHEPRLWLMNKPCHYEDSVNCFWDAGSTGNRRGHSFVARFTDGTTCVLYLDRRYAKKHDTCFDGTTATRLTVDLDGDGGGAERA